MTRRLIVQATTLYSAFVYSFAARHKHTQVKQNTSDYSRQKISRPPGCLYAVCNSSAKQNALEYPRQEIRRPPRLPIKTTRYICTSEKRKTSEYLRQTIYNSCPSRLPSEQKTPHRRFSTKNQQKQKKGRVDIKRVRAQEIRLVNGKAAKCQQGLSANLYVCTEMPAVKSIRILHLSRRHY